MSDHALQKANELITAWKEAVISADPQAVLNRYQDNAVLVPTVSNQARGNQAERLDYFNHFLKNAFISIEHDTSHCQETADALIASGHYHFKNAEKTVGARYTYVFDKASGLIVHHHSSLLPE